MDFSFIISGMAGDGIKSTSMVAGKMFSRLGYYVFIDNEYQSLIRGGHNFSIVRVSDKKIWGHRRRSELLIALQDYTISPHNEYVDRVIFDSSGFDYPEGEGIPMTAFAKEVGAPTGFRNAAAIGALCYMYGVDIGNLNKIYKDAFGDKAEKDILLAEKGYKYASENLKQMGKVQRAGNPKPILDGNQASGLGAVKAGLKDYYAYPMTPASSLLHFLASMKRKLGVTVVQPENEISVAIMAIGSAFIGRRAMIGTSGGGFALMHEAISLAGMAEMPILCLESQRGAPSTGLPTYNAQEDLKFVLHAGHGEFPRIVASPGDTEDAYYLGGELLNLSWKYQSPAILLTDRYLSENLATCDIDVDRVTEEPLPLYSGDNSDYRRYSMTESGVSPLAFPPDAMVNATGNEHDEYGFTIDTEKESIEMYAKRMRKEEGIREDVKKMDAVRVFGKGTNVLFTWGSTTGVAVEAASEIGDIKVVQIRYLSPFPDWEIEKLEIDKAVTVECNYTGQLRSLLKEHGRINSKLIGNWGGRQFSIEQLAEKLKEAFE